MRASPEAHCPRNANDGQDPDPMDRNVPMIRVFQTFCNAVSSDLKVAEKVSYRPCPNAN